MTFSVRPLTIDDCDELVALRLEALRNDPGMFASSYEDALKRTKKDWQDLLVHGGTRCFGLYDVKKPIGLVSTYIKKDDATNATAGIGMLYIQPEYRGRGLARQLFEQCVSWSMKQHSLKKLVVACRHDNEASRRVIEGSGFVFTHRASRLWPDNVTCDEMWYALDLERLRPAS